MRSPARDINRTQRVEQAIRMRIAGAQWAEIATACGWSDKSSAYNAVNSVLKGTLREAADELRTLEVLRLDALLESIWPQATPSNRQPNLRAVDRVLAIMERRAKLLGLDTPANSTPTAQVVIRSYGAAGDGV
jgi:hypothetical protein